MNLESRKIEFVQEFLKLQSEDAVSRLEEMLRSEMALKSDDTLHPMTKEELDHRIDQSESDFKNNRYKASSEVLSKFK